MGNFIVDIHTHFYPPTYIDLLASRKQLPRLITLPSPKEPRLVILPADDDQSVPPEARGRPVSSDYSDIAKKISFMTQHGISTSVVSLANPWLDFLPAEEAGGWARKVNDELNDMCNHQRKGALYAIGTLPTSAGANEMAKEIERISGLTNIKGVILGTTGLGTGLDDEALDPVWEALADKRILIFIHPHYGLPSEVFGPRAKNSGHVLPLALGFPMETTVAFTRMYLSGVFDRNPQLKVLLAHAGGTVPFLAGRIESCMEHERHFRDEQGRMRERRPLTEVLRSNVWLDAVAYSPTALKAAVEMVGKERVLFGTDHPFFPPLDDGAEEWLSVRSNLEAVTEGLRGDEAGIAGVLGRNAVELLGLERSEEDG